MRGLVRRDLTADETGRRDQKRVLPGGGHIEKWAGQNRIAIRAGPEIGRCVRQLKKARLDSGCSSLIEPEACLRSPTGAPPVVDGGVPEEDGGARKSQHSTLGRRRAWWACGDQRGKVVALDCPPQILRSNPESIRGRCGSFRRRVGGHGRRTGKTHRETEACEQQLLHDRRPNLRVACVHLMLLAAGPKQVKAGRAT